MTDSKVMLLHYLNKILLTGILLVLGYMLGENTKPQPSKSMPDCGSFSNSLILDYNVSRFLFTNSLKSLPFSRFFESKARS